MIRDNEASVTMIMTMLVQPKMPNSVSNRHELRIPTAESAEFARIDGEDVPNSPTCVDSASAPLQGNDSSLLFPSGITETWVLVSALGVAFIIMLLGWVG